MNGYASEVPLRVDVAAVGGAVRVKVKPRTDAAGKPLLAAATDASLAEVVAKCCQLRREAQAFDRGGDLRVFLNDLAELEREEAIHQRRQTRPLARGLRSAGRVGRRGAAAGGS